MNQILYTGGKNKNGVPGDVKKIVIFLVILILIFAIVAILIGTNLLNKVNDNTVANTNTTDKNTVNNNVVNSNTTDNNNTNTNPETPVESNIRVDFESKVGAIKTKIVSAVELVEIVYWWDEEEGTTIEVQDKEYEFEIPSKQGTHTLKMEVTDSNGYTKTLSQRVIGDAGPELTISTDGVSNYVIKAKDDEKVEKIVIVLNGETQEVEANEKEFEYKVAIPQGDSLIDVTVYNLNGLTANKKAKITNFGG